MKEFFIHSWKKYLFSFIYAIVILLINNLAKNQWASLINYCDGAFIAGATLICIGALSIVTKYGAFDIFSFMFDKKGENGVKRTFYDYCESKKEIRSKKKYGAVPYFTVGIIFLFVSAILVFVLSF